MCRTTPPPCRPVAPVTSTVLSAFPIVASNAFVFGGIEPFSPAQSPNHTRRYTELQTWSNRGSQYPQPMRNSSTSRECAACLVLRQASAIVIQRGTNFWRKTPPIGKRLLNLLITTALVMRAVSTAYRLRHFDALQLDRDRRRFTSRCAPLSFEPDNSSREQMPSRKRSTRREFI